ncbi:MAG: hypothetical protein MHM6MM_007683, partial [Cercozoa sp. M6MM]
MLRTGGKATARGVLAVQQRSLHSFMHFDKTQKGFSDRMPGERPMVPALATKENQTHREWIGAPIYTDGVLFLFLFCSFADAVPLSCADDMKTQEQQGWIEKSRKNNFPFPNDWTRRLLRVGIATPYRVITQALLCELIRIENVPKSNMGVSLVSCRRGWYEDRGFGLFMGCARTAHVE